MDQTSDDGDEPDVRFRPLPDMLMVTTDGPKKSVSAGGDSFFNRFSINGSRRNSAISSISSIDKFGLAEFDTSNVPRDEIDLFQLVRRLTDQFKKTSSLKEALGTILWLRLNPHAQFGSKGMTLLHAAALRGESKLVSAFGHCRFDSIATAIDFPDFEGNTALHIAVIENHPQVVEALLKIGSFAVGLRNSHGWTPLQISSARCQQQNLELMIKYVRCDDHEHRERQNLVDHLSDKTLDSNETLLHLACRAIFCHYLDLKDTHARMLESGSGWDEPDSPTSHPGDDYFSQMEDKFKCDETRLQEETFPVLELLLDTFVYRPELLEEEDTLPTSPGLIMHYFASFNYLRGIEVLLKDPFFVNPNTLNKHGVSALWLAAKYNFIHVGITLLEFNPDLEFQADPNIQDPVLLMTPLHFAVYGYHSDRVDATCRFIDILLKHGANPLLANKSGETAPHLAVVKTRDYQVMAKFIDHLGRDALDITDDQGSTLFHYAVGCLDDSAILKLMEKGASLMKRNFAEVSFDEDDDDPYLDYATQTDTDERVAEDVDSDEGTSSPLGTVKSLPESFKMRTRSAGGAKFRNESDDLKTKEPAHLMSGLMRRGKLIKKQRSVTGQRLPLQEAIKNGNSDNYFNALRRMDFKMLKLKMRHEEFHEFLCTHLVAATREVRPDIVRLLFQQVSADSSRLHSILLYSDKTSTDETFSKTALEWAVENNDRLCTTEILHQEFECHKESKVEGLSCLRRQLTGDELLMWTIETFTLFYERTWAQRYLFPLFGLMPLFISISSFVYDYYSDLELTFEYYDGAFNANTTASDFNSSLIPFGDESSYTVTPMTTIFDCNLLQHYNSTYIALPLDLFDGRIPNNLLENCSDVIRSFVEEKLLASSSQGCADIIRQPDEFRTAFFTNLICIAVPLIIFYVMCARELLVRLVKLEDRMNERIKNRFLFLFLKLLGRILWLCPVSLISAPFFILYIAIRQVYFKFHHNRAKRKNKFRRQLQKSEYLWGISRTAEAGLESCGQLILQVWLLSSDFNYLSRISFADIVDKTYNGIIFFLSFSIKPADDIEKSLGKMFMSFVALVFGVSACYRTLKRGAVGMSNTAFIYLSLLLQIFARIFSVGLYYFAVRSFLPATPILLGIHFVFVFAIKMSFEKSRLNAGMLSHLVCVINIFANSLVYVRIVPIERSLELKRARQEKNSKTSHDVEEHSTFMVQTLFFALVLFENILMASTPLFFNGKYNRAYACLGQAKLLEYVGIVIGLCVASWLFHIGYYKYMGHPWSAINGPQFDWTNGVQFKFYGWGKDRKFTWNCGTGSDDADVCDTTGSRSCCCSGRSRCRIMTVEQEQV